VPHREIFVTEFFTLNDPNWVGDMRTEPKKLGFVNCWADIRHFVVLAMTSAKTVYRTLRYREKLFSMT
jgi:hypothetical protein